VDTDKLVTDRGQKRQNGKFRADITRLIPCPIDLWIDKMKTVFRIIPGDGRNVALPPAPVIAVGLVDQKEARGHGADRQQDCQLSRARHGSRLDKALRQSQSSTW